MPLILAYTFCICTFGVENLMDNLNFWLCLVHGDTERVGGALHAIQFVFILCASVCVCVSVFYCQTLDLRLIRPYTQTEYTKDIHIFVHFRSDFR